MLVQDRAVPKLPKSEKSHIRMLSIQHWNHYRFSESKSLDFPTWVLDNLYRLITVCFLIFTVAAIFFLYNSSDTAASFLWLQTQTQQVVDSLSLPQISWNSIPPTSDKSSPYANYRTEKWIVVSVSDYPSDSLKKMVRINGWQVLAIGNSKKPKDWSLKGAIFLSLDAQANSGFRVVDFLPYESCVRKSVGYLFAIQHGAKKIFDCDDRGEVIGDDLGKLK